MTMQSFTPVEYLMIDVANNYGHDKLNWDERIQWFKDNESNLENMNDQAEEPALYYAGVKAYRQAKTGQPIAYPISLDATSSGAQILAVLIGCEKSASLCNVVDTGKREDLYTNVYLEMCNRIGDTAKIHRSDTKQAIMTALYGSKAQPRKAFGEGPLLDTFYQTMNDMAPGIWQLNEALLGLWQPTNLSHDWVMPDNFHVHVKVMVDHKDIVHFLNRPYEIYSKVNAPMKDGLSIGANVVHSIDGMIVREITRRCDFDSKQKIRAMELVLDQTIEPDVVQETEKTSLMHDLIRHYYRSGFMSARIIDLLDSYTIKMLNQKEKDAVWDILESMPEKPFHVLSVHDCFRVHPNYGNDLRKQYNQLLSEIAKSTMLQDIASQIVGTSVNATKLGDLSKDVLEANYALG